MERDGDRRGVNDPGRGGGTSGTGPPEASGRDDGATGEVENRRGQPGGESDEAEALSGGDDSTEAAIGRGGADKIAGTGSSAERSGRRTSEGADPLSSPPDAGDPGGMGGVRADTETHDHRPPGGVGPMAKNGKK